MILIVSKNLKQNHPCFCVGDLTAFMFGRDINNYSVVIPTSPIPTCVPIISANLSETEIQFLEYLNG